jgi:tetratricopeptide (TPR) repeat protein
MSRRASERSLTFLSLARVRLAAWFALLVCALSIVASTPTARAQDEAQPASESALLADWLAQAGLDEVLAVVLDEQVRKAGVSSPAATARLAEVYVRLAAAASDEERVADLRRRVERFLLREKVAQQFRLRLAIGRADYRMALRGIERLRQGQGDPESRAQTIASLEQARIGFVRMGEQLASEVEELRTRMNGSDDAQRIGLMAQIDENRDLLLGARFLEAWCGYWLVWMDRPTASSQAATVSDWPQRAQRSLAAWADLLETGKTNPEPTDCSLDLMSEEYYAQSVLGMALAKSLTSGWDASAPWFALLDKPGVWPGLVDHTDWQLHAMIDAGAFEQARVFASQSQSALAASALAGAAMRAVQESRGENADAMGLARSAIQIAANRGDFGAIRRLTRRIPALARGGDFAASLARGIDLYDKGRSTSVETERRTTLDAAARELRAALDGGGTEQAVSTAVRELLAWSLLGAGKPCEASESFGLAAAQSSGNKADEALWMAVQSGCSAACKSVSGGGARCVSLAREYLARFELGNHASSAAAIVGESEGAERDDALVERLLEDTLRGGVAPQVRETAALLLYRRFRGSDGVRRVQEARRLLSIEPVAPERWPPESVDLVLRQQLEAALDPVVLEREQAREILARVATKFAEGKEPTAIRAELALRRLSLAVADRDREGMQRAIDSVRRAGDSPWRGIAETTLIRGAEALLSSPSVRIAEAVELRGAIVAARRQLMTLALASKDPARIQSAEVQVGTSLLDCARSLREAAAEGSAVPPGLNAQSLAREALDVAKAILKQRPDDAQGFAMLADAAIACGQFDVAFEALGRLVGSLPSRSDEWFERKADLCELLAQQNPDEARAILRQHMVLIPDWGPGKAGQRLAQVAQQLGVTAGKSP